MKNKSLILQILLAFMFFSILNAILSDIWYYNLDHLKGLKVWNAEEHEGKESIANIRDKQWLEFAYNSIYWTLLLLKFYFLLGLYYLFTIFRSFEKEKYFSSSIINSFRKAGSVFLLYCIAVFVLKALFHLIFYSKNIAKHFYKFDESYTLLFICGLAFYAFAEIFKKAQKLQEENDLTI
ncbi:DUF2975 domain-containing protein [Leptobacterium flavescens]|uniref:DUF2975 domain-containing protein n=1 Tax=Leptobacterium flavescens TaxID=472055 RepID=A0A6P0UMV0_9FLAO|nr:DUF2975 domain-containing protein [Leptobacterium flavescens]NER14505.1 DUF2975 domain-containing protein [Leptobacterium flavescens]